MGLLGRMNAGNKEYENITGTPPRVTGTPPRVTGTPPRGTATAAPPPPPVRDDRRPTDPELSKSELLAVYLTPHEEAHIKKEFIGAFHKGNIKPEYANPKGFEKFKLLYGAIIKNAPPGRIHYIELLKELLNPAIHSIYDAKIAELKSQGKIKGGRRRNKRTLKRRQQRCKHTRKN